ncbi:MAG: transglutaminase family protein [Desulfobacterales bacterium]|nr:transglutaminase family protein [Desulfobacterales bacterium]
MRQYLQPTAFIDFDQPEVASYAEKNAGRTQNPVKKAVNLYYAVRDDIFYDPYAINLTVEGLRASTTLEKGRGWCVAKAVLLAACCRHMGIAARLGFADVKNHLSTQQLREQMQTDIFYWHGYTAIYLNEKWVKATPAFNLALCEKFSLKPLEFDGKSDSIFHPFDVEGRRHMEYIRYRGEYADVPLEEIIDTFKRRYPTWEELTASEPDAFTKNR